MKFCGAHLLSPRIGNNQIWEWSGPELKRISVVETTAPLGRVVWRPDKPYQLATCASVNETTVHVWDVRRPFLPYVTYDEHRDSVTDACWPSNDFDVFMSCGKDGLIVLHNIDSGHAPINYACDVAFDITPDGCMGLAVNSEIHAKNYAMLEEKAQASSGKKTVRQIPYETFRRPIKSLIAFGVPESLTHSLPPSTFYQIAEKYLIGGMEIMHLCEANSKVARNAGQEHVAQTWRLVEALCQQAKIQEEYDRLSAEEKARIIKAWVVKCRFLHEMNRNTP
uniref:GATOR2 complex protein WDR24 n=1 Tax=Caenorhabditis japonica TaxID=281687 RepID=A0A8R1IE66_CAEJA